MSYKSLFHGSEKIIKKPIYHFVDSNPHNDYGLGFYCTTNVDMAKEWANRSTQSGFANKYTFDERGLKILDLCDKRKFNVLNWIAILMHNREIAREDKEVYSEELNFLESYYINVEDYDVVIGFRADDAYFRFPMMFVQGVLTFDKLEDIYLNGNLGKQYVLISEKAFKRITFVKAIPSDSIYHERYITRKDNADKSYKELELKERTSNGKRIRDLMKEK